MDEETLDRLRTTEPAEYLSPSSELSCLARAASSHLYSSLVPFCPSKPPLDQLLSEESFDAEQIWSQIDLLSKPLLPFLRRHLSGLEKESKLQSLLPKPTLKSIGKAKEDGDEEEEEDYSEELELDDEEEEEGDEDEENEEENDEEEEEEVGGEEEGEAKGVEDNFLKIKELEKFLEDGEAKEYGLPVQNSNIDRDDKDNDNESDQDEEADDDEEDAFGLEDLDGDSDEEVAHEMENARYEDFFGRQSNKGAQKKSSAKKVKFDDRPQVKEIEYQETDDENENDENNLSTHEKESAKLRSTIEEMERANLEPKSWTMTGEVTAAKRPVNSALEVDLDFEHNVKPAPVITEEVTASLEELIKKRIIDGQFDDVQRASTLLTKAPRESKELDESKSKKGLAEIYEEEFAQTARLPTDPISVSDELKKEAEMLFKKICSKLDALSHFHFAPKPVIEDMSIQASVPALAMEEIAPIAVSDAAMLAPEEIFEGKGDIKEERELSRSDKKRRRANKKRRFKTESVKRAAKRPRPTTDANGQ